MKRSLRFAALIAVSLVAVAVHAQQLTIQAEAGKATVLTKAEIESLPHTSVTTGAADPQVTYEGADLRAVLEKAGVQLGDSLRGKRMASCLLVEAADGYRVVIALPEIDPAFADRKMVLVYLRNGKPLDDKEGPYRLIIPDEKRMARWVRQVTTLKIVDVQ